MPATVGVEKQTDGAFLVTVSEGKSMTSHSVTLDEAYYRKLTAGKVTAIPE